MESIEEFWDGLSTKQKVIGGALAGVVTLGIIAARKKNAAGTASAATGVTTVDVPTPITVPSVGSVTLPSTGDSGTGSSGATGIGTSGATGIGTSTPVVTYTPPVVSQPAPVYVPPVLGAVAAPPVAKQVAPVVPVPPPIVPTTGAAVRSIAPSTYPGVAAVDLPVLQGRDYAVQQLITDGASLTSPTRLQLQQTVARYDATPIPENAANSGADPLAGFGGGNYYTDGPSVAAGIAQNENKLATDPAFVSSEIARTNQVIATRQAAGVSTADQTAYLSHLYDVQAQAGSGSGLGTTTRQASPSPTPTPSANENLYLSRLASGLNPDGSAATAGNMIWAQNQLAISGYTPPKPTESYTVPASSSPSPSPSSSYSGGGSSSGSSSSQPSSQQLQSDFQNNQSSQVVDGHTNPDYNSGKTITQAQYDQLSAAVASGGSAAQDALNQLSGARVSG